MAFIDINNKKFIFCWHLNPLLINNSLDLAWNIVPGCYFDESCPIHWTLYFCNSEVI